MGLRSDSIILGFAQLRNNFSSGGGKASNKPSAKISFTSEKQQLSRIDFRAEIRSFANALQKKLYCKMSRLLRLERASVRT